MKYFLQLSAAISLVMTTGLTASNSTLDGDTPMQTSTPKLRIEDRPDTLKKDINDAFAKISHHNSSQWGIANGSSNYDVMGFDDHHLIKALMHKLPNDQDTFTFLEIGAGNFQFGKALAKFLNGQEDLPDHIHNIRIISVRGEDHGDTGFKIYEQGRCTLFEFGYFKIENLQEEFNKHNLQLENKVDYIISLWCLRHLVDPVGTFQQAYNLLKPGSGLFVGDGFFFTYNHEDFHSVINHNFRMQKLLFSIKAPFLIRPWNDTRSCDRFAIKRTSENPLTLPLSYRSVSLIEDGYQVGSECITNFNGNLENTTFDYSQFDYDKQSNTLLGNDQEFFDEFTNLYPYNWINMLEKKIFFDKVDAA